MNNPFEQQEKEPEILFRIAEKNDTFKLKLLDLLHQYPDQFVHGLFEEAAEQDYLESDIMTANQGGELVGALMFNRKTNEYNWLAVSKKLKGLKSKIARQLFESFYPTIKPGTIVHFFVNTEDAFIPGHSNFSGKGFDPARKLYRSMGLEIKEENRINNKYGEGAHAYKIEWEIPKTQN